MSIRDVRLDDLPVILEIEEKTFSTPWKMQGFEDAYCDDRAIFLVNEVEGHIASYGIMYVAADEAELPDIACAPEYRRRGLTEELLRELIDRSAKAGARRFFLEVRQTNVGAQNMYAKVGFDQVGIRPGFYRNPDEDAYVMSLDLDNI